MGRRTGRARGRMAARGGLLIALVLILIAAAGMPVVVHPQTDELRPADAIFVLGGSGYDRYKVGFELEEQGWAPTLVVSNPNGPRDPWLWSYCHEPHADLDLRCFVPDPAATRGEAEELQRLAEQFDWQAVIVVTYRPHVSRARYILQKCYDGELIMVPSRTRISVWEWIEQYAYQAAGYLRAALSPGC
ncbi:YdcF family protein [Gordonia sp. CPCC 205515]|uniref:YdcF family protein n=1 Tax=Gordonia sp. CPCC 205515 TaxID=3140791 RepID=UPI003AF36DD5